MNFKSKKVNLFEKIIRSYVLVIIMMSLIYCSIPAVPAYAAGECSGDRVFTLDLSTIPGLQKFVIYPDRLEARNEAWQLRDPSEENYQEGDIIYSRTTSDYDVLELTGVARGNIVIVGAGGDINGRPSTESHCTIRLNNLTGGADLWAGEYSTAYNNKKYDITLELLGKNQLGDFKLGASGGQVTIQGEGSLDVDSVEQNRYRRFGYNDGFLHYYYQSGSDDTATLLMESGELNVKGNLLCTQQATTGDSMGGSPSYIKGASKPATLIQNGGKICAKAVVCGFNLNGNQYNPSGGNYIQTGGFMTCTTLANGGVGSSSYYDSYSGHGNSSGGKVSISGDGVIVKTPVYNNGSISGYKDGNVATGGVGYRFPQGNSVSEQIPAGTGGETIVNKGYFSGISDTLVVDSYGRPVSKITLKMDVSVADAAVIVTLDDEKLSSYADALGQYVCYIPVTKDSSKVSIIVNGLNYRGIFKPSVNPGKNVFQLTLGDTSVDEKFKPRIINNSSNGEYYTGQMISLFVTAESTLTGNAKALNYEWEKQKPDLSFTAIPNTNNAIYKQTNITNDNAGTYRCKVTDQDGSFAYTDKMVITVAKREQVITAPESYIKTFGQKEFNIKNEIDVLDNADVSFAAIENDNVIDERALEENGTIAIKKTGVATIEISTPETAKYRAATKRMTIAVNKADVPITMSSNLEVTYGDDYNINVGTENNVAYKIEYKPLSTGVYSEEKPKDVGTYLVKVTTTDSNYEKATLVSTLVINKRTLYVTDIKIKDKVYDGNTKAEMASYKLNNVAFNDDLKVVALSEFADKNAGKRQVNLNMDISGSKVANYTYTLPTAANASIIPKDLNILIQDAGREYGMQNPKFSYTIDGFIENESIYNTNFMEPSLFTSAYELSEPGEYKIIADSAAADNYKINYKTGIFTIVPADPDGITVSVPNKIYDGQKIELNVLKAATDKVNIEYFNADTQESLGKAALDVVSGGAVHLDLKNSNPAPKDAGNYRAVIQTLEDGFHNVVTKEVDFSIDKAVLLVQVDNITKEIFAEVPAIVPEISGFVNDENLEMLSGFVVPEVNHPVNKDTPCGTYDITVTGGEPTPNYTFKYGKGIFTVKVPAGMKAVDVLTPFSGRDIEIIVDEMKQIYRSNIAGAFKAIIPYKDNEVQINKGSIKFTGKVEKECMVIDTNDLELILDLADGNIHIKEDEKGNTIISQKPEEDFIHNGDIVINESEKNDNTINSDKNDNSNITNNTDKPISDSSSGGNNSSGGGSSGGNNSSGGGSSSGGNNSSEENLPPASNPDKENDKDKDKDKDKINDKDKDNNKGDSKNENNSPKYKLPQVTVSCSNKKIVLNKNAFIKYNVKTDKKLLFNVNVKKGSNKVKKVLYQFILEGSKPVGSKWKVLKSKSIELNSNTSFKGQLLVKAIDAKGKQTVKETVGFIFTKKKRAAAAPNPKANPDKAVEKEKIVLGKEQPIIMKPNFKLETEDVDKNVIIEDSNLASNENSQPKSNIKNEKNEKNEKDENNVIEGEIPKIKVDLGNSTSVVKAASILDNGETNDRKTLDSESLIFIILISLTALSVILFIYFEIKKKIRRRKA